MKNIKKHDFLWKVMLLLFIKRYDSNQKCYCLNITKDSQKPYKKYTIINGFGAK